MVMVLLVVDVVLPVDVVLLMDVDKELVAEGEAQLHNQYCRGNQSQKMNF